MRTAKSDAPAASAKKTAASNSATELHSVEQGSNSSTILAVASDIGELTSATTKAINELAVDYAMKWVEMGKCIHLYVERVRSKGCKKDPYQLLADEPASTHSRAQLWNYEACYLLWQEIGGEESPKVSMTHFVLVLNQNISFSKKLLLLETAEQKGWSVSRLKKAITGRKHESGEGVVHADDSVGSIDDDGAAGTAGSPIDWRDALYTYAEEALVQFTSLSVTKTVETIPANTKFKLFLLVRFIVTQFFTKEEISEVLPEHDEPAELIAG